MFIQRVSVFPNMEVKPKYILRLLFYYSISIVIYQKAALALTAS